MFSSGMIITRYGYRQAFLLALLAYAASAATFYYFFYRQSGLAQERNVGGVG
jgi:fucose permease